MSFIKSLEDFFILATFKFDGSLGVWNLEKNCTILAQFLQNYAKKTVTLDVITTRPLLH